MLAEQRLPVVVQARLRISAGLVMALALWTCSMRLLSKPSASANSNVGGCRGLFGKHHRLLQTWHQDWQVAKAVLLEDAEQLVVLAFGEKTLHLIK